MDNDTFFYLAKILWFLFQPTHLLFILFVIAGALLWTKHFRWGRMLLSLQLIILLPLMCTNAADLALAPLEYRFPTSFLSTAPVNEERDIQGIITLGGVVDLKISESLGSPQLTAAAERLIATILLAKRYPSAEIVFSGYSGLLGYEGRSEAEAVSSIFNAFGLQKRVSYEHRARNTWENAIFSYHLLKPEPGKKWILVTSAYHMPRSVGVFRKAGWDIIPAPVDYHAKKEDSLRLELPSFANLGKLSLATREWIGLVAYYLTGKTSALFPDVEE